jgi:arginine utilization regulatory protein
MFLDEIDSMPSSLQAKLLRVLSEKRLRRVGDIKERIVDVRVVAAMTRLPEEAVSLGLLRNDLYYRLNVICLGIPPLRERRRDIPLLIKHFIDKFNSQLIMSVKGVSQEVFQIFFTYDWPGNVRELEHAIEGAMHMLDGDMILLEHLPDHIKKSVSRWEDTSHQFDDIIQGIELEGDFRETVRELENNLIRRAFAKAEGNISETARLLGIPRQTLQYRLKRLDMQPGNQ